MGLDKITMKSKPKPKPKPITEGFMKAVQQLAEALNTGGFVMTNEPRTHEEAIDLVMEDVKAVLVSKMHDYGSRNILDLGVKGVFVRVYDKVNRLRNLIWDHEGMIEPMNETISDTWTDIVGYGVIALMLEQGIFGLPLEDENEDENKFVAEPKGTR